MPEPIKASVAGVAKRGDQYSFIIETTHSYGATLTSGQILQVNEQPVTVASIDDEYFTFHLGLVAVSNSSLAALAVGDEVTVSA